MEFKELKITKRILDALEKKGYVTPTPIQEKTIPLLLANKDVIGIAQTGTGKTAAFTIPILQKLDEQYNDTKSKSPRALILAPTRELAAQIAESFQTYGKYLKLKHLAIFGGVGPAPQLRALDKGVDILIATPGRLMDFMNQGKIDLTKVEFFVLDEADRMLDMGFLRDVKKIASALSVKRQSLFFSATMSNAIADLTRDFLKHPVRIDITPESTPVDKIEQCVFFIDNNNKNELLLDLLSQNKIQKALVFVGMKHKANRVAKVLTDQGIQAEAIHGNKSQIQRTLALNNFKNGKTKVLIATDIAARGIDVDDITHVINYDLPNEPENYVHRIGRTARAGKTGIAYSFCCATDRNFLNQIERTTKRRTPIADHKYHSVKAKAAEGTDAKKAKRVQQPHKNTSNKKRGPRKGSAYGKRISNIAKSKSRRQQSVRTGSRRDDDSSSDSFDNSRVARRIRRGGDPRRGFSGARGRRNTSGSARRRR
jgi:ATP-dependent RNA helicase RhlE